MPDAPLVTFALFAYNQERFVAEAVDAALAQTYQPLQIILSDDGSSDGTFAIMRAKAEAYAGPHALVLNRNAQNLGIGAHVNRVMELAAGELVVGAAGDDISAPQRTATLVAAWLASGKQAMSLHSAVMEMSADGSDLGVRRFTHGASFADLGYMARHAVGVIGASHAWSRELFSRFGPLLPALVHEDIAIPFRARLLGSITYLEEPLVRWRVGVSSWHDMHAPSFEADEMRRRTTFGFALAHLDALQAYLDARTAGRDEEARLAWNRALETRAQLAISARRHARGREVLAALLAGASPLALLKTAVKFECGPAYALTLALKARQRGPP